MSKLNSIALPSPDEPTITLQLHRYDEAASDGDRQPVLLVHGASANHGTFTVLPTSLAPWLFDNGFDPWLLDWRGSSLVTDDPLNARLLLSHGDHFTFNAAAEFDVPAAIARMRAMGVSGPIAIVGHCMGAGIVSESIALGHLEDAGIHRVVLSTLGLFYETSIDSRLKSEDRVLERLTRSASPVGLIDPRMERPFLCAFPPELETIYRNWPGRPFHEETPIPPADEMCNRLRFMYGMPYLHGRMNQTIHASTPSELLRQFGGIPLHMYIHAARNIRQGHATFYDRSRSNDDDFVSDKARGHFAQLESLTLITGDLNRLWHRNSIDLMYEWLCRESPQFAKRVKKVVLPDYGHQDLLWSDSSPEEIFPLVRDGLMAKRGDMPKPLTTYDSGTSTSAFTQ